MSGLSSALRACARLLAFGLSALSLACATNLSEARPARVLAKGQMQITQANNIVAPLQVVSAVIEPGRTVLDALDESRPPTNEEQRKIAGAATGIALMGPGYGTHLDFGYGVGGGVDVSGRVGNGIYAASVRRGFELNEKWHTNVGLRAGYNSGGSWIGYLENVNEVMPVADLTRWDLQGWWQVGRELGKWGRLWAGAKAMRSEYSLTLDGSRIELGKYSTKESLTMGGGFAGVALGYRFVFFVMELTVLYARGSLAVFGFEHDLSGLIIAPTWGFQGTWGGGI